MARVFAPPAARTWRSTAGSSVAADRRTPPLDALTAGERRASRARRASRGGRRYRASARSTDDAAGGSASGCDGRPAWMAWTTPRAADGALAADRRPRAAACAARRRCGCASDGAAPTPALARRAPGASRLPAAGPRPRAFRLEILDAAFPARHAAPRAPAPRGRRSPRCAARGPARRRSPRAGRAAAHLRRWPRRSSGGRCAAARGRHGRGPRRRPPAARARLRAGRPPGGPRARCHARAARCAPYLLRLRSAGARAAAAAAGRRRVVDAGRADARRAHGVRLALTRRRLARARRELQPRLAGDVRRPRPRRADGRSRATPTAGGSPAGCRDVSITFAPEPAGRRRLRRSPRWPCSCSSALLLLAGAAPRRAARAARRAPRRAGRAGRWPLPVAARVALAVGGGASGFVLRRARGRGRRSRCSWWCCGAGVPRAGALALCRRARCSGVVGAGDLVPARLIRPEPRRLQLRVRDRPASRRTGSRVAGVVAADRRCWRGRCGRPGAPAAEREPFRRERRRRRPAAPAAGRPHAMAPSSASSGPTRRAVAACVGEPSRAGPRARGVPLPGQAIVRPRLRPGYYADAPARAAARTSTPMRQRRATSIVLARRPPARPSRRGRPAAAPTRAPTAPSTHNMLEHTPSAEPSSPRSCARACDPAR